MSLSAGQITLLRSEEQYSVLGLAILNPRVILAAQITDYTGTDMTSEFGYGNVTEGSYTNVLAGMIVYLGSTSGAHDLGTCRVRKAWTATDGYVGEESSLPFADGVYVTVVDAMDIRPKHLVVTPDEVFMDVDIAYSDQHEDFDPLVRMGGQVVVDVDSYPVTVNFPEVVNSDVFDSTISTYSLAASEGTVNDGSTSSPSVTIESYPTNGYIRVAETITAANGKSFTGYRYIFVFDSDNRPITDFVLSDCGADREAGGWSARVTLNDSSDIDSIRVGGLAVLFTKDYFDGENDVVGLYAGRENVLMSGWIYQYTAMNDPEFQPREFEIQSAAFWMSRMSSFPVGVEINPDAADAWTNMQNLTVDKGLFHFLHWRTTVTQIMDVYLTDDTRYSPAVESSAVNMWDQIVDIAQSQILAAPACNYNGMLAVRVPYNLMPSADRAAASTHVMDLEGIDYERQVEIERRPEQIAQVVLNGVVADEFGNAEALFSLSPGHVPARLGDLLPMPNLLLESQEQSNELAGLVFASQNNPYPDIPLVMNGANRAFDIAPVLYGTVVDLDEYTGIIVPNTISLSYERGDAGNSGKISVEVGFEGETTEADAIYVNGDIPDGDGGFVPIGGLGGLPPIDPLDLPDIPPVDFPPNPSTTDLDCSIPYTNYYPLAWSKPYLDGTDSTTLVSRAAFACKIRVTPQTYIDFSLRFYGDASEHVAVYATYNGVRVAQASILYNDLFSLYSMRAVFTVLSNTLVDGFEIELDEGFPWTPTATITIHGQFACSVAQVANHIVSVQETGAGNYAAQISFSSAATVHVWLPPGFIGRFARVSPPAASSINWVLQRTTGQRFQGLTDGLWTKPDTHFQYNVSGWLDIGTYTGNTVSGAHNIVGGVGTNTGILTDIDYNMPYYVVAGTVPEGARALDIYGATLNNVCAPS